MWVETFDSAKHKIEIVPRALHARVQHYQLARVSLLSLSFFPSSSTPSFPSCSTRTRLHARYSTRLIRQACSVNHRIHQCTARRLSSLLRQLSSHKSTHSRNRSSVMDSFTLQIRYVKPSSRYSIRSLFPSRPDVGQCVVHNIHRR